MPNLETYVLMSGAAYDERREIDEGENPNIIDFKGPLIQELNDLRWFADIPAEDDPGAADGASVSHPDSGMQADIYRRGNEIVVSFRGTEASRGDSDVDYRNSDGLKDNGTLSDWSLLPDSFASWLSNATGFYQDDNSITIFDQLRDAIEVVQDVVDNNPTSTVTLTGHSLGAALAALVSIHFKSVFDISLPATLIDPAPFGQASMLLFAAMSEAEFNNFDSLADQNAYLTDKVAEAAAHLRNGDLTKYHYVENSATALMFTSRPVGQSGGIEFQFDEAAPIQFLEKGAFSSFLHTIGLHLLVADPVKETRLKALEEELPRLLKEMSFGDIFGLLGPVDVDSNGLTSDYSSNLTMQLMALHPELFAKFDEILTQIADVTGFASDARAFNPGMQGVIDVYDDDGLVFESEEVEATNVQDFLIRVGLQGVREYARALSNEHSGGIELSDDTRFWGDIEQTGVLATRFQLPEIDDTENRYNYGSTQSKELFGQLSMGLNTGFFGPYLNDGVKVSGFMFEANNSERTILDESSLVVAAPEDGTPLVEENNFVFLGGKEADTFNLVLKGHSYIWGNLDGTAPGGDFASFQGVEVEPDDEGINLEFQPAEFMRGFGFEGWKAYIGENAESASSSALLFEIEQFALTDGKDELIVHGDLNDPDAGHVRMVVMGLDGNDTLQSGSGNDDLSGGLGSDLIAGGAGADAIYDNGAQTPIAEDETEDAFLDRLLAYDPDGNDIIDGGVGSDLIFYSGGTDEFRGGTGNDRYQLATSGTGANDQLTVVLSENANDPETWFGHDIISNGGLGLDRLVFEGLTLDDLDFRLEIKERKVEETIATEFQQIFSGLFGIPFIPNGFGPFDIVSFVADLEIYVKGTGSGIVIEDIGGSFAEGNHGPGQSIYIAPQLGINWNLVVANESDPDSEVVVDVASWLRDASGTGFVALPEGEVISEEARSADFDFTEERSKIEISQVPNLVESGTEVADSFPSGDDYSSPVQVSAAGGDDTIVGSRFNDRLDGGTGADSIDGGAGFDIAWYGDRTAGVRITVDAENPGPGSFDSEDDFLVNIEALQGSAFDDFLTIDGVDGAWVNAGDGNDTVVAGGRDAYVEGGEGNDSISSGFSVFDVPADENGQIAGITAFGGAGNDTLRGNGGNDTLFGGEGDDELATGNLGIDYLYGGEGSDTVYALARPSIFQELEIDLEAGVFGARPSVFGAPSDYQNIAYLFSIENARGDDEADYISGSSVANILEGGAGDDTLYGRAGNDTLDGGSGQNMLFGGEGDDQIVGSSAFGNSTFSGGVGVDTVVYETLFSNDMLGFSDGKLTISHQYLSSSVYLDYIHSDVEVFEFSDQTLSYSDLISQISGILVAVDDSLTIGIGLDLVLDPLTNDVLDDLATTVITQIEGQAIQPGGQVILASGGIVSLQSDGKLSVDQNGAYIAGSVFAFSYTAEDAGGLVSTGNINVTVSSAPVLTTGTGGDDSLLGTTGSEVILGFDGNDILDGGGGTDTLMGGAGNDGLYVNDEILPGHYDGGEGDGDILSFERLGTSSFSPTYNIRVALDENGAGTAQVDTAGVFRDHASFSGIERLVASSGDAELTGNTQANLFLGREGDDTLSGLGGNDTLQGQTGDDVFYGGFGDDRLEGGRGDDTFFGGIGDDTMIGDGTGSGSGDDTFYINLGEGNDWIWDDRGNGDTVVFGEGIEFENLTGAITDIDGDGVNSFLINIAPDQSLNLEDAFFESTGTNQQDLDIETFEFSDGTLMSFGELYSRLTFIATPNDDSIVGAQFGEIFDGLAGNDILRGNGGNDTFIGGAGNDTFVGGDGNDRFEINLGDGQDIIFEQNGGDRIVFGEGISRADLTLSISDYDNDGRDNVVVEIGASGQQVTIEDVFFANSSFSQYVETVEFFDGSTVGLSVLLSEDLYPGTPGADDYTGSSRADILQGLGGSDSLAGAAGNDTVFGGQGDDSISGGDGNDSLLGGDNNDTLSGDAGDDYHHGGDGDDIILASVGDDTFDGGLGNDTIDFSYSSNDIIIDLANNSATFESGFTEQLLNFENVVGGSGDNRLTGDAADNSLEGGLGNDTYTYALGGGSDTIDDSDATGLLELSGLNSGDVAFADDGDGNLAISFGDGAVVTVVGQFSGGGLVEVVFTNETLGAAAILQKAMEDQASNEAPVAVEDTISVSEDGTVLIDVLANDSDADGDNLSLLTVTGAVNGTAVIEGDQVRYTPDADFNGPETLSYTVSDGNGGSDVGTINVTVTAINDAPVAVDDTATLAQDTSVLVDVFANDFDVDGDVLSYSGFGFAANGFIGIDGTQISYTPNAGFTGTDSTTYTVADNNGGEDTATVFFTVEATNANPVANTDVVSVDEDNSALIDVLGNDTDGDGDTLTVTGVAGAANGTAVLEGNQVRYTPISDFNGSETLSYTISDGNGGSDTGTISVAVDSVNDGPVAVADAASVAEDGTVLIDVLANDSDVDGDALTLIDVTGAANGTAVLEGGQLRYTPDADFNGSETLSYTVSDGNGGSNTGAVTITVNAVNDAPLALDDSATLSEDGDVLVDVLANDSDPDGDALTLDSVGAPANGTVVIEGDQLRYTPDLGFSGTDNVTYTVSDGNGGTDTGTVTFTVEPSVTGPAPIGESGSVTVAQSGPNQWHTVTFAAAITDAVVVLGPLSSNDSEMATTRVRNVTDTGFEFQVDEWDYLDGVHGTETLSWLAVSEGTHLLDSSQTIVAGSASVGTGFSTQGFGTSLVNPVVFTEAATVNEASAITTRIRDVTSDTFQVQIEEEEAGGAHVAETVGWIAIEAGTGTGIEAVRTPNQLDERVDNFTFTTSFAVRPVLLADMQSTDGGDTTTTRLTALSATSVSLFTEEEQSANTELGHTNETAGYLALSGGQLFAADIGSNSAPVATDDNGSLSEDGTVIVDVVANDSDADGDPLTLTGVSGAVNGTATIESNQLRYDPDANFNGTETLTYTISDGQGGTDTGTIALTIAPENDAPVAVDDSSTVDEGAGLTISPLSNDSDIDGDALTITQIDGQSVSVGSIVTLASGASVEVLAGGQLAFAQNGAFDSLNTGESSVESFDYQISDGQGGSSLASIDVTINGMGSAATPIGEAGTLTVSQTSPAQWHSVVFGAAISDAIVVMGPLSNNDTDPATMRVRNVTDTGFEFQIDEYDYQDGIHGAETVSWLAMSEGSHTLANGSTLVAGTASAGISSYTNVSFGETLTNAVVLHEVTSVSDPDAVVSRVRNVDGDSFQVRIREQEEGTAHVAEEISWIAIEAGTGFGIEAGISGDAVNHTADNFVFTDSYPEAPVLLGDIQSRDGGDTSTMRLTDASATGFSAFIAEEQSRDTELNHTNEIIGWLALEDGFLF